MPTHSHYPPLSPSFKAALDAGEYLTLDRERELFQIYHDPLSSESKKQRARDEVILAHQTLVLSSSKKFKSRTMSHDDKFQEGIAGMMRAFEKFKPEKGFRFSTYARWWIDEAIRKAVFEHNSPVKTGQSPFTNFLFSYGEIAKDLSLANPNISTQEINAFVAQQWINENKLPQDKLQQYILRTHNYVMSRAHSSSSMEKPLSDDGSLTLGDTIAFNDPQQEDYEKEDMEQRIARFYEDAFAHIRKNTKNKDSAERMIYIFCARYIEEEKLTLEDLGQIYGVSRERIRQIEAKAIEAIKKYALKNLPSFMPEESYQSVLENHR